MSTRNIGSVVLLVGWLWGSLGCSNDGEGLVVYVSHDRALSEPVLRKFERNTGIRVRAVYDVEANKTTGLVNRILAEAGNPRADVFWNNEVLRTVQLEHRGILARLPEGMDAQGGWSDAHGHWAGFAGRMRVIVANEAQTGTAAPAGLADFTDERWRGRAAFANPRFGTTGTHFAALRWRWGPDRFRAWLNACRDNGVEVLPGNAQVRDAVAAGQFAFGLTDTDDVNGALEDGKPVRLIVPDQGEDGIGAMMIPNTLALLAGRPRNPSVTRLAVYLLSAEVEQMLARGRGAQYPLRHRVAAPLRLPPLDAVRIMKVDYEAAAREFGPMLADFEKIFGR